MQAINSRGIHVNTRTDVAINTLVETLRETHSVKFLFNLVYEEYTLLPRETVHFDLGRVITATVLPIECNDYSKIPRATLIFRPTLHQTNVFIHVQIRCRGLANEYNRIKSFLIEYFSNLNVPDNDIKAFWTLHDRPSLLTTNRQSNSSYERTIENKKIYYPMWLAVKIANIYMEHNTMFRPLHIFHHEFSRAFGLTENQLKELSSYNTCDLPKEFVPTNIDLPESLMIFTKPSIGKGGNISQYSDLMEYVLVYAWLTIKRRGGVTRKMFCEWFNISENTLQDYIQKHKIYFPD